MPKLPAAGMDSRKPNLGSSTSAFVIARPRMVPSSECVLTVTSSNQINAAASPVVERGKSLGDTLSRLKLQFNYNVTDRNVSQVVGRETGSGEINSFGTRMAVDF